ncbi:MAG: type II toxin-antitoxin system HicA family toxin [Deltaproteobacteria bacterium]|jgi:predicted RNA binding protein YcfA (HicA-like mRNA interferase family)|nr:type II toxin-antitoxin system HicA family toxin [Deltaproteobacteria bacterium]
MINKLKNTPIRDLIRALEQDGFQYTRRKGSQRVYRHPDGRRVVVHYHHAKDTLPPGTLRSLIQGTKWDEADLKRLNLIT